MDYDYKLYDNDVSTYHDSESYYYEGEDEENVTPLNLHDLINLCLKPSVYQTVKSLSYIFFWCFVYRLSILFTSNLYSLHHIISFLTGLLSLHALFSTSAYCIVSLVIITYIFLFISTYFQYYKYRGFLLLLISLCFMCICELWLVDIKKWHPIRGSQMIVVMKAVSLAFDLDIGKEKKIPNLVHYAGYLLCPSSCVFGPWLSYSDYILHYTGKWSWKSIKDIFIKFLIALMFLTISNCWSEFFIPVDSWKWFSAYRDALSFRTSHYFISFMSEAILLLSGFSNSGFNGVAKPLSVEFPRSIVNVVMYWNIPMHNWLKIYVFNTSRKFGSFFAILLTYAVSSLLHGINFQISAVLLSLGVYSYVEVMLRKKLATAFSACILAKGCKSECSHKYKYNHSLVLLTNLFLLLLTVFHLAYLGFVFGASEEEEEVGYSWQHTIMKWSSLNYLSHYVAFLTYAMYFFIK